MTPTAEQQRALDVFATGTDMVIEAGAGTGKTTTLGLLARTTPRRGVYIAFNKAAADDAGFKMPMTVRASTMHSLAFRATVNRLDLARRLNEPRMKSWTMAKQLGIGPVNVTIPPTMRTKVLQPGFLAGHVLRALRRFCESGDGTPGPEHFPYVEGIDTVDAAGRRKATNNKQLALHLIDPLERAWEDARRPDGRLPYDHAYYLKVWQLDRPELPGDFVLFDEAQDANGVMLAVLDTQRAAGKQMVYVGDSQQQIYEWRGAVNALASFDGQTCWLTQSFRFGPAIAEVANAILDGLDSPLRLTGTDRLASTVGPVAEPRAVLCRSNAAAIRALLSAQRNGRGAHLVGGDQHGDLVQFVRAAARLQAGERVAHRDLAPFESWREVQQYVDEDPQGTELKMMVGLLDDYGCQIVLDALDGHIAEREAEVIISTAHKAKGREWSSVRLAGDFDPPTDSDGVAVREVSAAEWRLLYVACTRAQDRLDPTGCQQVKDLIGTPAPEPDTAVPAPAEAT